MSTTPRYVQCQVYEGLFEGEREVAVPSTTGAPHHAIVDMRDVKRINNRDAVRVHVVHQEGDRYLVDLPRETFTSGPRVWVPKEALVREAEAG